MNVVGDRAKSNIFYAKDKYPYSSVLERNYHKNKVTI